MGWVYGGKENVSFVIRVEKSRSDDSDDDGKGELRWLGLENEKKNDQDETDRLRQDYSKGEQMHNETAICGFKKEEEGKRW